MGPALIVQAVGLFALTNIDDDLDLNWGTPADQERRDEFLLAFCAALAVRDAEWSGPRQHHRLRRRDLEGGQYDGGPGYGDRSRSQRVLGGFSVTVSAAFRMLQGVASAIRRSWRSAP